ncbi:MAG: alkyl sulfatase dimerization domain-containing protein [Pseudomonadota bacterium]
MNVFRASAMLLALQLCAFGASAAIPAAQPASAATAARNAAFGAPLPLADRQDFAEAQRGKIAPLPSAPLLGKDGRTVWDGQRYSFLQGAVPASVNPSLWRQEQLNNETGLFKVSDRIYQVRGYDVSNMTLIEGHSGWIVIDPLLSAETGAAALALANEKLGSKPVVAIIYTHGHVDHFGGVRGVLPVDAKPGSVRIIAPEGFMESAVAENVMAGNAMGRRAQYQFGAALDAGARGTVGAGLGQGVSVGNIGLVEPTDIVRTTGQELVVDGMRIVFEMANGSEAPSEFVFYLPELKALCLSEVVNHTMHNIYTLRGARMRDALGWSKYINTMLDLFPDAEVAFRSHHWPVWGKDRLRGHLVNQRDMYRFIHDEALHLANAGQTMDDIGNADFVPKALQADLSTHGYYGTLSHNLRAVYDYYLGWYDGNPATLNRLPRSDSARRHVEAMGGAQAVLAKARKAYAAGDYRWVAEMLNYLVFADPSNEQARRLQADTLEQLGYQAESSVWRNEYLTAARELRQGVRKIAISTQGADLLQALSVDMMFDFLAVRLDHRKTDGLVLGINLTFTDLNERYALELSNSVLNNTRGRVLPKADVSLTLTRAALLKMLVAKTPLAQLVQAGEVQLQGNPQALAALFGAVDNFDPLFNIVTP